MTEASMQTGKYMSAPSAKVADNPLKTSGEPMAPEQAQLQGQAAVECLVKVDYDSIRGTCGDERPRIGLLNGEAVIEDRPSVWGGPNVYALYVGELTGYFGDSNASGKDRLVQVTRTINGAGIKSGGHKKCAANASIDAVFGIMADKTEEIRAKAQEQLGEQYDGSVMDEVLVNARKTKTSGRYTDWHEGVLEEVLGDEAGEALEILADVPHEGRSVVRQWRDSYTINQTTLHHKTGGEDSFDQDEQYADKIENALATGPNPKRMKQLGRHAREALLVAISLALPNEELTQINVT